jgi:hypothetical protein
VAPLVAASHRSEKDVSQETLFFVRCFSVISPSAMWDFEAGRSKGRAPFDKLRANGVYLIFIAILMALYMA